MVLEFQHGWGEVKSRRSGVQPRHPVYPHSWALLEESPSCIYSSTLSRVGTAFHSGEALLLKDSWVVHSPHPGRTSGPSSKRRQKPQNNCFLTPASSTAQLLTSSFTGDSSVSMKALLSRPQQFSHPATQDSSNWLSVFLSLVSRGCPVKMEYSAPGISHFLLLTSEVASVL